MKCILHIGTEKTGTTTLLNWLIRNEAVLYNMDYTQAKQRAEATTSDQTSDQTSEASSEESGD